MDAGAVTTTAPPAMRSFRGQLREETHAQSRPHADFVGEPAALGTPPATPRHCWPGASFGFIACYLRVDDRVYETHGSTGHGTEAMAWSYALLDRTVDHVARRPGRTQLLAAGANVTRPSLREPVT